jgi:hypothetical protein
VFRQLRVSVVIPAFNEGGQDRDTIAAVPELVDEHLWI